MSTTLEVLNELKFKVVNDFKSPNIELISVTFVVFHPLKLRDVKLSNPSNKYDIRVIFDVFNPLKSNVINFLLFVKANPTEVLFKRTFFPFTVEIFKLVIDDGNTFKLSKITCFPLYSPGM